VRKNDGRGPWAPPLLGPYLERALGDLLAADVAVAVEPHAAEFRHQDRRRYTALAAGRAIGASAEVHYRPDGRPELAGGPTISASHGGGVTAAVVGAGTLAIDVESAVERGSEEWAGLLGHRTGLVALVSAELSEGRDVSATRVWAAAECLQKAGLAADAPLTVVGCPRPGWGLFGSGPLRVATFATSLRGDPVPVVFAILVEGRS
jgi:enediyne polyketide synthase